MKITTKEIALIGMIIAVLEATKLALSAIPNVEITTLLIILFTLYFDKKIILAIPAFILIEGCIYGFGSWWAMYAYIWPAVSLTTLLFKNQKSVWFWSIFSACWGLFFGALCSLTYLVIGGPSTAFSWWISGLLFDIIHCVSNFVLCLILFKPLSKALDGIYSIINR